MKSKTTDILVLLFFLSVYLLFAGRFVFDFPVSRTNYFNYLAQAFLQGKTYLISIPSSFRDLSLYQDKIYVFWSPVVAIIITPLVYFWGLNLSDALYTAFFGGLNCWLFYLILKKLAKTKLININRKGIILGTIFFAFGTVHFYLSLFGRVWFTSQVFSLTMLLLAILFIFKYFQDKKMRSLIVAGFFYAGGTYNRFPLGLAFPFFGIIIFLVNKSFIKQIIYFLIPFLIISGFYLYWNYVRFGAPLEIGHSFLTTQFSLDPRYLEPYQRWGLFNLHYLPQNVYYNFLSPLQFKLQFPFILPNPEGNGLFFTSPLFIYLFLLKSSLFKKTSTRIFVISLITAIFLMLLPLLVNIGTGWFQFGARYLLDMLPFLIILVIIASQNFKSFLSQFLLVLSCFINVMAYFWWRKLGI